MKSGGSQSSASRVLLSITDSEVKFWVVLKNFKKSLVKHIEIYYSTLMILLPRNYRL
ncbi:MAG: hypothetical protein FWH05_02050 [Oscillospiraceae bacterium]|nr:hypothetical protein [Oscillospiraceae bacterium]